MGKSLAINHSLSWFSWFIFACRSFIHFDAYRWAFFALVIDALLLFKRMEEWVKILAKCKLKWNWKANYFRPTTSCLFVHFTFVNLFLSSQRMSQFLMGRWVKVCFKFKKKLDSDDTITMHVKWRNRPFIFALHSTITVSLNIPSKFLRNY